MSLLSLQLFHSLALGFAMSGRVLTMMLLTLGL